MVENSIYEKNDEVGSDVDKHIILLISAGGSEFLLMKKELTKL